MALPFCTSSIAKAMVKQKILLSQVLSPFLSTANKVNFCWGFQWQKWRADLNSVLVGILCFQKCWVCIDGFAEVVPSANVCSAQGKDSSNSLGRAILTNPSLHQELPEPDSAVLKPWNYLKQTTGYRFFKSRKTESLQSDTATGLWQSWTPLFSKFILTATKVF